MALLSSSSDTKKDSAIVDKGVHKTIIVKNELCEYDPQGSSFITEIRADLCKNLSNIFAAL